MRPLLYLAFSLPYTFVSASFDISSLFSRKSPSNFISPDTTTYQSFDTSLLFPRLDTGECTDSIPCSNGACCSTSGFCGYSPEFCGTGNCTSNCDATAECGEYAPEGEGDCPLNVCCSQYGFCGTTSDFCGTGCQDDYGTCGDVTQPSCTTSTASQRVIGYYESWSLERSCGQVEPEDLNLAGFTHANLAFAYFDPGTFAITAMDSNMLALISRFTALKSTYQSLETWISVGGWSFSDPGSTQTAWSTMASTSENRATFITNLLQFVKTYGFDGVDLDWEYPGASDRGGSDEDGDNFVSLVKEMRTAFGKSIGISVTLPTSYWYLQGFKPVEMESHVNWFNLMAYDLHGTWDSTDIYTGPYIRPHTNLTEISEALDLLWRAGVDPGDVVLGQGWYGRSFTLADPDCSTPNGVCEFTSGGNPGECTQTSGILSNAEIQQIIADNDVTPVYDEEDAINYIVWDTNQWVSYDDATTYEQKLSFANDLCLGGMMVWAVDLNNQSTKTGYGSQADTGLSDKATTYANKQAISNQAGMACYTSNCGDTCMSGYTAVTHMKGQPSTLQTEEDCPDDSSYEDLCCASGTKLGTCTWRGWRGVGLPCSGGCLSNETLITQNTNAFYAVGQKSYDHTCNGGLQSYCCDGFVAPSSIEAGAIRDSDDDTDLDSSLYEADLNPVVSIVVATITEAAANAAKTILDTVATDFCEAAVPVFLEYVSDLELAIPVFGEIAIAVEWADEQGIVKLCEEGVEDAGDAVLSWAGYTSSTTLEDITETITSTSTGDWVCEPSTCTDCSKKRRKGRRNDGFFSPVEQDDARPTQTTAPEIPSWGLEQAAPASSEQLDERKSFRLLERADEDSPYGSLDMPASGKLDAWAADVFASNPKIMTIDTDNQDNPYESTSSYIGWAGESFYAAIKGFEGCTSVILTSDCGVYWTHFWEPLFRPANLASFQEYVINRLTSSDYDSDYWIGIPSLPSGCFTSDTRLKAVIYSRTSGTISSDGSSAGDLSSSALYSARITDLKNAVASALDIDAGDIATQLYTRTNAATANAENSAMGKLILTFNPDVLNSDDAATSSRAAYQIWSGLIVQNGRATSVDSAVTSPVLEDYWDGYTGASSSSATRKRFTQRAAEVMSDGWRQLTQWIR